MDGAFARLLDEKLHDSSLDSREWPRRELPPAGHVTPRHPLLFRAPFRIVRRTYPVVEPVPAPAPELTEARVARRLSTGEHKALHVLNALGAQLRPDFTASELKSAYRRLARRYHPDAQIELGEDERLQLGQRFAALARHYRVLAAL